MSIKKFAAVTDRSVDNPTLLKSRGFKQTKLLPKSNVSAVGLVVRRRGRFNSQEYALWLLKSPNDRYAACSIGTRI